MKATLHQSRTALRAEPPAARHPPLAKAEGALRLPRLPLPLPIMTRHPLRLPALCAMAITLVLMVSVSPSCARLTVCNHSWEPVSVALAYPSNTTWFTKGWWVIDPMQCSCVMTEPLTHDYYYLYASSSIEEWSGDSTFCIAADRRFHMRNTGASVGAMPRHGFRKIVTRPYLHYRLTLVSHYSLAEYLAYRRRGRAGLAPLDSYYMWIVPHG